MDSFELNKIIAAILMVALLVIGLDKIADGIFHVEKPKIPGYKVEVEAQATTVSSSGASDAVTKIDITALMATGDLDYGKKVFKKCAACHSIVKDGGNKIGPALYNVVGRTVGGISDYKYSKALSTYGKTWDVTELNGFLLKPKKWIPNNKMGFAGLKKPEDRAAVILYMNSFSDNPLPLK